MEKERAVKAIWLRFRGRAGEMMGEITAAQNYNQGRPRVFSFSAFIRCGGGGGGDIIHTADTNNSGSGGKVNTERCCSVLTKQNKTVILLQRYII